MLNKFFPNEAFAPCDDERLQLLRFWAMNTFEISFEVLRLVRKIWEKCSFPVDELHNRLVVHKRPRGINAIASEFHEFFAEIVPAYAALFLTFVAHRKSVVRIDVPFGDFLRNYPIASFERLKILCGDLAALPYEKIYSLDLSESYGGGH